MGVATPEYSKGQVANSESKNPEALIRVGKAASLLHVHCFS